MSRRYWVTGAVMACVLVYTAVLAVRHAPDRYYAYPIAVMVALLAVMSAVDVRDRRDG